MNKYVTESDVRKKSWNRMTEKFLSSKQWKIVRQVVIYASGSKCAKCGNTESLHCDHIIPRIKDPQGITWFDTTNLQVLCKDCHKEKGLNKTDYRTDEVKERLVESKERTYKTLESQNLSMTWNVQGILKEERKEIPKFTERHERMKFIGKLNRIITESLKGNKKRRKILTKEQHEALELVFKAFNV
jgi:5-methylcytosine-specific restriction endonuclease McrA